MAPCLLIRLSLIRRLRLNHFRMAGSVPGAEVVVEEISTFTTDPEGLNLTTDLPLDKDLLRRDGAATAPEKVVMSGGRRGRKKTDGPTESREIVRPHGIACP